MDELMRHQPSLRVEAMNSIIKLLNQLIEMGRNPNYVCQRQSSSSSSSSKLASLSAAVASSSSSRLTSQTQATQTATVSNNVTSVKNLTSKVKLLLLIDVDRLLVIIQVLIHNMLIKQAVKILM